MPKSPATARPVVDAEPGIAAAVLRAAQAGDRAARADLLRSLQDVWYRFCRAMLMNEAAAREATQETALRFLQGLPGFQGGSSLRTWSLGIALNVCREMRRRSGREASAVESEQAEGRDPGPGEAAAFREERDRLAAVLRVLPARQREALALRYFEGLPLAGVAAAMGCAQGTVKATLSQALRRLRQLWENRHADPS